MRREKEEARGGGTMREREWEPSMGREREKRGRGEESTKTVKETGDVFGSVFAARSSALDMPWVQV